MRGLPRSARAAIALANIGVIIASVLELARDRPALAEAQPAPEEIAHTYGVSTVYRIAEGRFDDRPWMVGALIERDGERPCLFGRRAVQHCFRSFEPTTGLDWRIISLLRAHSRPSHRAVPSKPTPLLDAVSGFAPAEATRVTVRNIGAEITVPALAIPGTTVRAFVAPFETRNFAGPIDFEVRDARDHLVSPSVNEPNTCPWVAPDVGVRKRDGRVLLSIEVVPGHASRNCRFSVTARFQIEGVKAEAKRWKRSTLSIDGNPVAHAFVGKVPGRRVSATWVWSNWCDGSRTPIAADVEMSGFTFSNGLNVSGEQPIQPACEDRARPSRLRLKD